MTIAESHSRPIVIGYDGRPSGEDGLALARLLASRDERPLVVVSALDRTPGDVSLSTHEPSTYEQALKEEAERLAEEARSALQGRGRVETVSVRSAWPARELIAEAIERGASAIVIGSSHRSRIGRVLPGGVGERLLSGAPCPLALAPREFAKRTGPELRHVGIAYDGSPESKLALEEGVAIVRGSGGSLRLLFASHEGELVGAGWGGVAPLTVSPVNELRIQREWLERELAQVLEELPAQVSGEAEVLLGRPASTLVDASRDLDLLVLGSRSYGPIKRVLFGGVSGAVVREAACPVLVTPRSAVAERSSPRVTESGSTPKPPRIGALDDSG